MENQIKTRQIRQTIGKHTSDRDRERQTDRQNDTQTKKLKSVKNIKKEIELFYFHRKPIQGYHCATIIYFHLFHNLILISNVLTLTRLTPLNVKGVSFYSQLTLTSDSFFPKVYVDITIKKYFFYLSLESKKKDFYDFSSTMTNSFQEITAIFLMGF